MGLLLNALASLLARLEPYGMLILIGLLLILPLAGAQFGLDLSVVSRAVGTVTNEIIGFILWITGHTPNAARRPTSAKPRGPGSRRYSNPAPAWFWKRSASANGTATSRKRH
jgi:hypothetical protein